MRLNGTVYCHKAGTPADTTLASLEDLRAAPRRRSPTELLRYLERIDAIRAHGLGLAMPVNLPSAPFRRTVLGVRFPSSG